MVKKTKKKASGKKTVAATGKDANNNHKKNGSSILIIGVLLIALLVVLGGGGKSIEEGSIVKVHYTGTLNDGTVFDSSEGKDPLEFTVGENQVIPGFEKQLKGMSVGDKKTLKILTKDAYGKRDEKKVGDYLKENIPEEMKIEVGNKVFLQSPDGGIIFATILEIKEEVVSLDLNHPLAGEDLTFDVEIIEVQ